MLVLTVAAIVWNLILGIAVLVAQGIEGGSRILGGVFVTITLVALLTYALTLAGYVR